MEGKEKLKKEEHHSTLEGSRFNKRKNLHMKVAIDK